FLREPLSRLCVVGRRPASVEPHVAVLHPPELLKSLPECGEERRSFQVVLGIAHQYADPPHALGSLSACGSRPRRGRPAEQRDEPSPPQIEHLAAPLPSASPLVSLPHRQPAAESPTSPWGRPELS